MPGLLPQEINFIGEKHVIDALLADNFTNVKVDAADDEFNYITADGVTITILLRIRTVLAPAAYGEFNDQEKAKIISNAILQNRIPYAAYVVINADNSLNGEISWYKLS